MESARWFQQQGCHRGDLARALLGQSCQKQAAGRGQGGLETSITKELSPIPFQAEEGSVPQCPLSVPALYGGVNTEQRGLPAPTLLRGCASHKGLCAG